MPILIAGELVVSIRKLREHLGHPLYAREDGGRISLWCDRDLVMLEQEPEPREPDLPCGCATVEDHNEDLAIQTKLRKEFRIHRDACVGCYLGDDGIAIHSCVIHDPRYWPQPA